MKKKFGSKEIRQFQEVVLRYYRENGRDLSWRKTRDPYKILISEIMLHQTHVRRVIGKYEEFISRFPDIYSIESASLQEILKVWNGLGYNRRALFLKKLGNIVVTHFNGKIPSNIEKLESLPGIGNATSRSICVFAFNKPEVFIETNIRTVFIYHFFSGRNNVRDSEILPLIERTLDRKNPRIWYYALMDYGVEIKRRYSNPGRKSFHYKKQPAFIGSNRHLRGVIIKMLIEETRITLLSLLKEIPFTEERIKETLKELEKEGFIKLGKRFVKLAQ